MSSSWLLTTIAGETTIVPIVKNKSGNLSDSSNYRPIALATIISKMFESVLLLKCAEYLSTSDNQFGFKSCHSTDLCIYTLKEFIDYYKTRGTTVYVTFLDASKAFDRIDHWLLFDKMIKKGVPLFIIKLLVFWYSRQRMFVRWGDTCSTSFCVTNGVKQGGIISPMLFNLYMDDLSLMLNCSGIGGYIGTFLLTIYVTLMTCALLVYLPVVCNTCLIFVMSMQPLKNYYIMDQSHFHYVSRKTHLKSVLHHFIWIR